MAKGPAPKMPAFFILKYCKSYIFYTIKKPFYKMKKFTTLIAVAFITMISACCMQAHAGPPGSKDAPVYICSETNFKACNDAAIDAGTNLQAAVVDQIANEVSNPVAAIDKGNVAYGLQSRFKAISSLSNWRMQKINGESFDLYYLSKRQNNSKTLNHPYDHGPLMYLNA